MIYREFYDALLKPEDHRHEVGEATDGCYNCKVDEALGRLSGYETAALGWYLRNVNRFTFDSGIVRDLFAGLGLADGPDRRVFIKAMDEIFLAFEGISVELARKELDRIRSAE